jgi:hypothetical protein
MISSVLQDCETAGTAQISRISEMAVQKGKVFCTVFFVLNASFPPSTQTSSAFSGTCFLPLSLLFCPVPFSAFSPCAKNFTYLHDPTE